VCVGINCSASVVSHPTSTKCFEFPYLRAMYFAAAALENAAGERGGSSYLHILCVLRCPIFFFGVLLHTSWTFGTATIRNPAIWSQIRTNFRQ
jgi:hypothetical protein